MNNIDIKTRGKGQRRHQPRVARRQLEQQRLEPALLQSQQRQALQSQQQRWLPPLPAQFFAGCKPAKAVLPVY
jgi:hypothetical protein